MHSLKKMRFLDAVKPIMWVLPDVRKPDRQVSFKCLICICSVFDFALFYDSVVMKWFFRFNYEIN